MPINTTHPQYDELSPRWQRMTDVCNGEDVIKKGGEKYLPMPNKDIRTTESLARYENYKARAVFVEVTKDTLDKYTGQAFKDDPVLNVDKRLDYMKRDANGAGLSIYQLAQKCFEAQLERGKFGLFVDYPAAEGEVSVADIESKSLRPTINYYKPESIINWRTTTIGGQTVTTLIVLQEYVYDTDPEDIFSSKKIEQWRYLGLDEKGYFVEVWRKNDDTTIKDVSFVLHAPRIYPTRSKQDKWNRIPFVIGGSDSNDWCEQNIPLESLAKMNLAHYRNSADYEGSVFTCGQVQAWMSGVSEQRMKSLEAQGIRIGAGSMIMLEENGKFGFAQAEPNSLAGEAMDKKYAIMQALGAKLAEGKDTKQKTATQSNHESGVQNSTASMCIANLNEAMQDAILFCYEYLGIEYNPKDGDYLFRANQDFTAPVADSGLMTAIGGWVQGGLAPKSVAYNYQRKYNLIDPELKDEEIDDMIDSEPLSMVANAVDNE
ncbi:DUF4055 domain-containing protein [Psychrobacter sp. BF1]|uniref:DUF4055 domain-containing protein n=1 Tax=Psychrobacter sp. BF1 TaxID=2821147 RepID=UPI001C4E2236|nr:DUF4055 domain-containing protein [Psychrobacter sp. BF1]